LHELHDIWVWHLHRRLTIFLLGIVLFLRLFLAVVIVRFLWEVPYKDSKLLGNSDCRISDRCVNSSFNMDLTIFNYCSNFVSVVKMLLEWESFVGVCRFYNFLDVVYVNSLVVGKEILLNLALFIVLFLRLLLVVIIVLFLRLLLVVIIVLFLRLFLADIIVNFLVLFLAVVLIVFG